MMQLGTADRRFFQPHMLPQEYGGDIRAVGDLMIRNRNAIIGDVVRSGTGLEIGALHNPTPLGDGVQVLYVDYLPLRELKERYQEYAGFDMVEPDIVDDGETLAKVARDDLDFIIANHFIEHCQNPILALESMQSKLRPGGLVVLAIPDKRYTFDAPRANTDFAHLVRDYEEGPAWSRRAHYEDFATATCHLNGRTPQEQFEHYYGQVADIHFHVWDHGAFFDFIQAVTRKYDFPLEATLYVRNGFENLCILQKIR